MYAVPVQPVLMPKVILGGYQLVVTQLWVENGQCIVILGDSTSWVTGGVSTSPLPSQQLPQIVYQYQIGDVSAMRRNLKWLSRRSNIAEIFCTLVNRNFALLVPY